MSRKNKLAQNEAQKEAGTSGQESPAKPFVLVDVTNASPLQFLRPGTGAKAITLSPGINAFGASEWAEICGLSKAVERCKDAGLLIETPASERWNQSLAEFDLETARRLVNGSNDLQALNAWRSNEPRQGLQIVITERIEKINALRS